MQRADPCHMVRHPPQPPRSPNPRTSRQGLMSDSEFFLYRQVEVAEEQKKDYNYLWRRVDFCVTKLEKLGDTKYESKSESEFEEEEGEGNEEEGGN